MLDGPNPVKNHEETSARAGEAMKAKAATNAPASGRRKDWEDTRDAE
jgi:hypothetical protein